jgi:chitin disaccharide deacetylase
MIRTMAMERAERLLIVNADDFGVAPGVTRGILELARCGAVTSTSTMINLPCSEEAVAVARSAGLDMGLHLNICLGAPLLPPEAVPSLVAPNGRFVRADAITRRRFTGQLRLEEVEREWSAQIERFLTCGVRPSHLDSHCHLHAYPGLYRLTMRLAVRYGIPGVRRACAGLICSAPHVPGLRRVLRSTPLNGATPYQPDHFSVLSWMGLVRNARPLEALLRALPPGVTELVCHPGHVDDELRRVDTLTTPREREWLVLSRPAFRHVLVREGVRLTSWAEAASYSSR